MKVVILVANGFHLGQAGCYGNDWTSTPALDRLAAEGVVFDQHYAGQPSRAAAWQAWLGNDHLRRAGIPVHIISDQPPPFPIEDWHISQPEGDQLKLEAVLQDAVQAVDLLAEEEHWVLWLETATLFPPWPVLEEEPIPEGAAAEDATADGDEPDTQDELDDEEEEDEDEEATEYDESEEDKEPAEFDVEEEEEEPPAITEPVLGPLGDDPGDRIFVGLAQGYSGAMMELDAGLEWLYEQLGERGLLTDAVLAITSDQGYPLGEHGVVGPEPAGAHEESVHVPLLLRLPAGRDGGRRIEQLTRPDDLLPTLFELQGQPVPPDLHGASVLPLLNGTLPTWRTFVASRGQSERALRSREWCLLVPALNEEGTPALPRLYLKPDDRWEVNDVAQHHAELVEQLEQELRALEEGPGQPG